MQKKKKSGHGKASEGQGITNDTNHLIEIVSFVFVLYEIYCCAQ